MMIFIGEREKSEYSNREVFTRHGGAYDRGSADAYYHRSPEPHYFTGASYQSTKIEEVDMSEEEINIFLNESCTSFQISPFSPSGVHFEFNSPRTFSNRKIFGARAFTTFAISL